MKLATEISSPRRGAIMSVVSDRWRPLSSVLLALGGVGLAALAIISRPRAEAAPTAPSRDQAVPAAASARPACRASVEQLLAVELDRTPALDDRSYQPPSDDERAALDAALRSAANDAPAEASRHADAAGYALCWADDVVVAVPSDPSRGHARVALRRGPARPLVIEAPHPFHDLHTRAQATALFDDLSLRAVIVSGTYRCSNPRTRVDLPGHTKACGSFAPFPTSDMAHNPHSLFQQAHETLLDLHPETIALSMHGMAGAGASLSDGTRLPTSADTPVARFARALRDELPETLITSCNPGAGVPVRYRLCGTTNAQGRATNGTAAASYQEPAASSSRFLHLEQSPALRDRPEHVAKALVRWLDGPPARRP